MLAVIITSSADIIKHCNMLVNSQTQAFLASLSTSPRGGKIKITDSNPHSFWFHAVNLSVAAPRGQTLVACLSPSPGKVFQHQMQLKLYVIIFKFVGQSLRNSAQMQLKVLTVTQRSQQQPAGVCTWGPAATNTVHLLQMTTSGVRTCRWCDHQTLSACTSSGQTHGTDF